MKIVMVAPDEPHRIHLENSRPYLETKLIDMLRPTAMGGDTIELVIQ